MNNTKFLNFLDTALENFDLDDDIKLFSKLDSQDMGLDIIN